MNCGTAGSRKLHARCITDIAGWMLRSFRSLMFVRRLKDVAVVAESEVLLALPGCQPNWQVLRMWLRSAGLMLKQDASHTSRLSPRATFLSICNGGRCALPPMRSGMASYRSDSAGSLLRGSGQSAASCTCALVTAQVPVPQSGSRSVAAN